MKEPVVLPQPDEMPEKYPNRFKPGQSGNPGGRPKKTPEELQAIAELKRMTPEAVKVVVSILKKESASLYARLQAAEIIFNRAMGRPETYLKVEQGEQSVEASAARLQALFASADDEDRDNLLEDESEVPATEEAPAPEVDDHAV